MDEEEEDKVKTRTGERRTRKKTKRMTWTVQRWMRVKVRDSEKLDKKRRH